MTVIICSYCFPQQVFKVQFPMSSWSSYQFSGSVHETPSILRLKMHFLDSNMCVLVRHCIFVCLCFACTLLLLLLILAENIWDCHYTLLYQIRSRFCLLTVAGFWICISGIWTFLEIGIIWIAKRCLWVIYLLISLIKRRYFFLKWVLLCLSLVWFFDFNYVIVFVKEG